MPKDAKETAMLIAVTGTFLLLGGLIWLVTLGKVDAAVVVPILATVITGVLGAAGLAGVGVFVQRQTERVEQAKAEAQMRTVEMELMAARTAGK